MFRHLRRSLGDGARPPSSGFRWIELVRVEPNQAQPLADRIISQILKEDAKTLAIRKLCVILSLPAEIRKNLEAMTNVADNEEWRPPLRRRKRLGVILPLLARLHHQDVPGALLRALAAHPDLRLVSPEQIALH